MRVKKRELMYTFTVMLATSSGLLDNFTMESSPWFKKIHHLGGKSQNRVGPFSTNREERNDSAVYNTHFLLLSKIHEFDIKMSAVMYLSF